MTGVNGLLDPHGTELLVHPVRYGPDRPDVVNDMREVDEAQAHALRAVAIGRTYAATSGAHQCVSRVVEPVEREDDCCALADEEALALRLLPRQGVPSLQLLVEDPRVHDHTAPEHELAVQSGDSRRQEMELERRGAYDNGVASVVPALEPNSPVRVSGELVYGLALALVPPLGPEHYVGRQRVR